MMKNIPLPPKPWQQRLNIFTHSIAKTKKQRKRERGWIRVLERVMVVVKRNRGRTRTRRRGED